MSSQMNAKIRRVRCPRCFILLPEPADVPVYKCGGCDQILQAKVRKEDIQEAGASSVHEADPTKENDLGNFSEDDKATTLSIFESDLDKISEKGEDGTGCNTELLFFRNQSNLCSDGISCYKNTGSSADATQLMNAEEAKIPFEQCCREDCNESTNDGAEYFGNISVSSEIPLSSESNHHENVSSVPGSHNELGVSSARKVDESPYTSENNTRGDTNVSEICDMELHLGSSYWKENSSSDLFISYEVKDPSQPAGVDTEVDENVKKHSSTETSLEIMQNDQNEAAQSSSSVSADYLTCPCTEPDMQAQNGVVSDFQRVSSAETLEVLPRFYSKNDLGVTLKSPTAKRYYSYDVGASSCHETDDKATHRRFQPLKRNVKDASYKSDKPGSKRGEFMVNDMASSESKMQHRPTNFSSSSPGKKLLASKDSQWHQNAFLEPAKHRHPVRSITSSSINYREKKLFAMHINPLEADKLELLRMVYELQDQLSKAQTLKGIPHRRLSAGVANQEEQFSSYNDHFAVQREDPDANYHMYPGRNGQDVTWLQRGNHISHMAPMSSHTALTNPLVNCLCLRCRRQERYYSAQLPRHVIGSNKGQYNRPYRSASGPQHYYTPSELRSHYTYSDDNKHNHRALEKKLTIVKQHFLPIAGGSPILACYRCFEMLHMPADFLLFNKRCHRLKCSACGEVLMFLLQKKRTATISHAGDCPHSETVSFSDDYGKSFCRSCSTERDQFPLVPPFDTATGIFGRKKMTVSNSLESKNERMKSIVVEEFPDKQKIHGKTLDAERPSSEIEELPPSSAGSQLHQLMGYPSPSRLIYKYSYSD